jgi:hypothetical protein
VTGTGGLSTNVMLLAFVFRRASRLSVNLNFFQILFENGVIPAEFRRGKCARLDHLLNATDSYT